MFSSNGEPVRKEFCRTKVRYVEDSLERAYSEALRRDRERVRGTKARINYFHHGWGRYDFMDIELISLGDVSVPVNKKEKGIYFRKGGKIECLSLRDILYWRECN